MTTPQHADNHRSVTLARDALGAYTATNVRGGTLAVGSGDTDDFTPVELLLAAIGGCTMIDVDHLTSRRAEPTGFAVEVGGDKVTVDGVAQMQGLSVRWEVTFPEGEAGDEARRMLPRAIRMSHDRLCTVGCTVKLGSPIATIEGRTGDDSRPS
ncbi:OsmC family protein [Arsenicicoccus sp. oral taxon 190]|uniref:OsmC family protein n=1 Tax=Arsenicicoccus sp. oral taxon 190 TaxID=1658671 RepID=UPI00067A0869|nr:OsmC family protein [Arsenicicoccus sp. oral taxon 190]AKT51856.1 oxidoreductase [Arsenicicoccus sp. oral taxon 190]